MSESAAPDATAPPVQVERTVRRIRPRTQVLGAGTAVLAALAVGHVVVTAFPVDERQQAFFVRPATVGEPVELRYARLTAGEPAGSTVLDPDGGSLLTTTGVWLTVPLTIEALGQPRALSFAEVLGGDGRTYLVSTGGRSSFLAGTAQPGVARYTTLRVELPPGAVAGAHLRVGLEQKDQRRDDVAEVDLGLTQADADAWAADDHPVLAGQWSDQPPEQP
ncbi:MAG: hypothetical protein ACOH17_13780 [Cellulomonas sp.]